MALRALSLAEETDTTVMLITSTLFQSPEDKSATQMTTLTTTAL